MYRRGSLCGGHVVRCDSVVITVVRRVLQLAEIRGGCVSSRCVGWVGCAIWFWRGCGFRQREMWVSM